MTEAAGQPSAGFVTPQQGAAATEAGQYQKVQNAGAQTASGVGGGPNTMTAQKDAGAAATTAALDISQSDADAAAIARQQIAGQASAATNLSNIISGAGGLLGGITHLASKA